MVILAVWLVYHFPHNMKRKEEPEKYWTKVAPYVEIDGYLTVEDYETANGRGKGWKILLPIERTIIEQFNRD
jgi:hypothetical protein